MISEIVESAKIDLPPEQTIVIPYLELPKGYTENGAIYYHALRTFAHLKQLELQMNPIATIPAGANIGIQLKAELDQGVFSNGGGKKQQTIVNRLQDALGVGVNLIYEFE